jgi:hypothetical protein
MGRVVSETAIIPALPSVLVRLLRSVLIGKGKSRGLFLRSVAGKLSEKKTTCCYRETLSRFNP